MSFPENIDPAFLNAFQASDMLDELKQIAQELNKALDTLRHIRKLKHIDISRQIRDGRSYLGQLSLRDEEFNPTMKVIIRQMGDLKGFEKDDQEGEKIVSLLQNKGFVEKLYQKIEMSDQSPDIKRQEKERLQRHIVLVHEYPDVACMNAMDFTMAVLLLEATIKKVDQADDYLKENEASSPLSIAAFSKRLHQKKSELLQLRQQMKGYARLLIENDQGASDDNDQASSDLNASWLMLNDQGAELAISHLEASQLVQSWVEIGNEEVKDFKRFFLRILAEVSNTTMTSNFKSPSYRLNDSISEPEWLRLLRSNPDQPLPRIGDFLKDYVQSEENNQDKLSTQGWGDYLRAWLGYSPTSDDSVGSAENNLNHHLSISSENASRRSSLIEDSSELDTLYGAFKQALEKNDNHASLTTLQALCENSNHPNRKALINILPQLKQFTEKAIDLAERQVPAAPSMAKSVLEVFVDPRIQSEDFESKCIEEIRAARPTLEVHRGFKKIFESLLPKFIREKLSQHQNSFCRFFKTDSVNRLDDLKNALEHQNILIS